MRHLLKTTIALTLLPLFACECDDPLAHVKDPGAISGRICDPADARGIYGARVWVVQEFGDGTSQDIETVTDAEGNFLLEPVPVGSYSVNVARGSFHAAVEGVVVEEGAVTALDASACIEPEVTFTVYDGHDSVEQVLTRIGYAVTNLVDTRHEYGEHDETTPSWLVEQFGDYDTFKDNDILFINCAAHEWALDNAAESELSAVLDNLRLFVAEGGSVYLSDWSYDLLELLYPDAVEWYGDDLERDAAQKGRAQAFVGEVVDDDMKSVLGRDRAALRYDYSRIAVPASLGEGTRSLINADILIDDDGTDRTYTAVPVLLEHRPITLDPASRAGSESDGRIIFTTFHNGENNTEAMDEVLRAIVYAL